MVTEGFIVIDNLIYTYATHIEETENGIIFGYYNSRSIRLFLKKFKSFGSTLALGLPELKIYQGKGLKIAELDLKCTLLFCTLLWVDIYSILEKIDGPMLEGEPFGVEIPLHYRNIITH